MSTESEMLVPYGDDFTDADAFVPRFELRARFVSGNSRKWRTFPVPSVQTTKAAVQKAIEMIDDFNTIVRVEIYADGRYIKEVPSDGADPDNM